MSNQSPGSWLLDSMYSSSSNQLLVSLVPSYIAGLATTCLACSLPRYGLRIPSSCTVLRTLISLAIDALTWVLALVLEVKLVSAAV
jgi:hypothetical protein